jgi:hypothetical protein
MPATAKETSRKFGIPLSSPQQVLNPNVNIQLGAAYLSQVHGQFNGNRVLASAAYNAGPGRVRQWLRGANHLSFDVWVETIPFDETRQYVHLLGDLRAQAQRPAAPGGLARAVFRRSVRHEKGRRMAPFFVGLAGPQRRWKSATRISTLRKHSRQRAIPAPRPPSPLPAARCRG